MLLFIKESDITSNAYETPYPDYFIRTNPNNLYAIPQVIDETIYYPLIIELVLCSKTCKI